MEPMVGVPPTREYDDTRLNVAGAHRRRDRPVGGVVRGGRDALAGGDPVLRGGELRADVPEGLQRGHCRGVGEDTRTHFDVPLKIELSLGTYRACTGTTGRRHAFGLRKSGLGPNLS